MRKVLQCCFSWLLLGVAGGAVAGTVTTIVAGTYTLKSGNVYQMSVANETGVIKAWTLSTAESSINAALQVDLGSGNNTVILNLTGYSPQTDGLQDANNKYVPALKVTGKGTLIIRHGGKNSVYLRIKDKANGEQPAIDLSGMTGGEVRFERAAGATGDVYLWLQRVWADSTTTGASFSAGNISKPVIIGNPNVRLTFAEGIQVRFQASPCVVKSPSPGLYVLPELVSGGYASMRIEAGAVVRVLPYKASTTVAGKNYSWTRKKLFPAAVTLAGGSLELENSNVGGIIAFSQPQTEIDEVVAAAIGQGSVFGKTLLTVSTKSSVVPVSCIKVVEGQTLDEAERRSDENGRLLIDATKSPELVYAQTSASNQDAVTLFGLTPETTEAGCTVTCNFGIAALKVDQVDNADFVSTLKISVDLPTETASTRSLYLRILQTAPNGDVTTIYPTSGTAALTTFTRDATNAIRFSASVPCRITPSLGTTAITIRAYATPPAE